MDQRCDQAAAIKQPELLKHIHLCRRQHEPRQWLPNNDDIRVSDHGSARAGMAVLVSAQISEPFSTSMHRCAEAEAVDTLLMQVSAQVVST